MNVPTARDPWVILQSVPGVLVDRVNVGGNESGQQSYFVGKGVERHQTEWNVDGVAVTDMATTGTSTFYYDFDSFEQIEVSTGSSDPSVRTPGVHLNMVTKRGTNELKGSARFFTTDQELAGQRNDPRGSRRLSDRRRELDQPHRRLRHRIRWTGHRRQALAVGRLVEQQHRELQHRPGRSRPEDEARTTTTAR